MDRGTQGWKRFGPAALAGVTAAVLVVAVFGAPLASVLLVGLLLLCPLMMLGMHEGSSTGGSQSESRAADATSEDAKPRWHVGSGAPKPQK